MHLLFRFSILFLPAFMLGLVVHRVPNEHTVTFASLQEKLVQVSLWVLLLSRVSVPPLVVCTQALSWTCSWAPCERCCPDENSQQCLAGGRGGGP